MHIAPTPWRLVPEHGGDAGPFIIDAHGELVDVRKNGCLISAAPDLLEALQLLHDSIAEFARINNLGGFENHDMKMARAAIAKATGEQS